MLVFRYIIAALFALLGGFHTAAAIDNPEEFVNLLAGTFTDGRQFSTGNTLPLVGLPWGFNHWAPQTRDQNQRSDSWWFDGNEHQLAWLRCTHQPSPWIGDWGWFLFAPMFRRNALLRDFGSPVLHESSRISLMRYWLLMVFVWN